MIKIGKKKKRVERERSVEIIKRRFTIAGGPNKEGGGRSCGWEHVHKSVTRVQI